MHDVSAIRAVTASHVVTVSSTPQYGSAGAPEALHGETCEVSWRLKKLVGLELWLQEFFGQKPVDREKIDQAEYAYIPEVNQ